MKTGLRISLKVKLLTMIIGIVLSTALILTAFFIYTQRNILKNNLEKKTRDIAEIIANSSEFSISTGQEEKLKILTANALIDKEGEIIYAVIYDRDAVVLAKSVTQTSIGTEIREFLSSTKPDEADPMLFWEKEKSRYFKLKNVGKVFEVFVPIVTYDQSPKIAGVSLANDNMGNENRGYVIGIVRVGVTIEILNKQLDSLSKSVGLLTVIVVLGSSIISFLLIKILIGPIKELVIGTKKLSSGDLSYRVPLISNDELSDLAQSFNSMAQDIKGYVDELNREKQDLMRLKVMLEQRSRELEETLVKMQNMQEELLKSEKFATIGRLAASVAHELRNPLASLKNISYYLSKTGNFQDEKAKKMLDMLSADVARSNKIITDLLDFSRAKKLNKISIMIDDFIDKAILNVTMPDNIKIEKDVGHFNVVIDPDKMMQVLINIISNARDAMSGGGLIKISSERIGNYAEIKIIDNGSGMDKNTLLHIFDPLFTTKLKGIGLGLSIVKEIVDAHFGTISAKSVEGKGTEFAITLPME
ncbi:MAG: ATP-binding protein [Endomicrobia bacterium]|nr:ATP-binding protein [Endomicrobiia bacterium]MCL2799458.1 ATP-binding protein [Endomicrobiia bacterium]